MGKWLSFVVSSIRRPQPATCRLVLGVFARVLVLSSRFRALTDNCHKMKMMKHDVSYIILSVSHQTYSSIAYYPKLFLITYTNNFPP